MTTTSTPSTEASDAERLKSKRKSPGLSIVLDADQEMAPPAPRVPTGAGTGKPTGQAKPEEGSAFGWLGPQPSPRSFWQQSPVVSESSAAVGLYSPATPQLPSFNLVAMDLEPEPNWTLEAAAVSGPWSRAGSPSAMLAMMGERRNGFAGLEIVGQAIPCLEQAMATTSSPQQMVGAL